MYVILIVLLGVIFLISLGYESYQWHLRVTKRLKDWGIEEDKLKKEVK